MFNLENIQQLFSECKKYLELQTEYTKLEMTEKLSKLLATLFVVVAAGILGICVLFYLSLSLAFVLAPEVGGMAESLAIIACGYLLLGVLIVALRKPLIVRPTVKLVAGLMPSTPTTPESIVWQKEERLQQVRNQKEVVVETAKDILSPLKPVPAAKPDNLLGMFGWGTAVMDGAMLGWRVIKKVRSFFKR